MNLSGRKDILVDDGVVAGNVYDKYGSRNPIVRRLMRGFLGSFTDLAREAGCETAHEVGCGEGHLSMLLAELGMQVRASDVSGEVIRLARRNAEQAVAKVDFAVAGIEALDPRRDTADLVVCCEVLEHVDQPAEALRTLCSLARSHLLLSVPREPIWRALNVARGRYLRALGNTPGHVNHWSTRSFLRMIRPHVEIVAIRRPLPWTMVLCRPRAAADS